MTYPVRRLSHVASTKTSNVDKKSYDGEVVVRLCNYTDVYKNDIITADMNFMVASATKDQVGKFGLRVGDTVFTKDSETADDIGVPAYVGESAHDLVCGYHLAIARPLEGAADARFLYWCLASPGASQQWSVLASGVTRVGLRQADIGKLEIPVPPLQTQRKVAAFLDRETAQIDALIGKQERLIDLLAEKRQATITHAVTKGLDPAAPTKPSGMPWLGDIPAHWTTSQLGTWLIHKIEGGYSPTASGIFPDEEDWGVLSLGAVGRGEFLPDNVKAVDPSAEIPTALEIRDGDLLLTRSNVRERVGFAAVVQGARPKTIFPDLVYRLGVNSSMVKHYLACFLSSTPARAQIESSARGSSGTMPKISHDQIRAWQIPLPPLREQQEIVDFLRSECARIDRVSLTSSSAIGVLRERRSALISAAVTGKINCAA